MTKGVLCALGLFLISVTLYATFHPMTELTSFMSMSTNWSYARIGMGLAFIMYALFDSLRQWLVRALFALGALVALVVVLFSFINLFVLAIDTFCLLAGGIYALLGSLELRTEHPIHVHWPRVSLPIHPLIELRLHHRTRSIA